MLGVCRIDMFYVLNLYIAIYLYVYCSGAPQVYTS